MNLEMSYTSDVEMSLETIKGLLGWDVTVNLI